MINLDGVQLSEVYTWETGRPHISLIFSWIFSIFSNSARAEADPKNCSIFLCTVRLVLSSGISGIPGNLTRWGRCFFFTSHRFSFASAPKLLIQALGSSKQQASLSHGSLTRARHLQTEGFWTYSQSRACFPSSVIHPIFLHFNPI